MYLLNNSFIYQRHYNVDRSKTLYEYVSENINRQDEIFEDVYYVISNKSHQYEINLIGSLIIEEIKKDSDLDKITRRLLEICDTSYDELNKDIIDFIYYLKEIEIVKDEKFN